MNEFLSLLIPLMWVVWGLYWGIQSRGVKANVWAESIASRSMHVVPLMVASLLLVLPERRFGLGARFLPPSVSLLWIGSVLTAVGLLLAAWARRHLARNWSGDVTLKVDHELITSGPYAWVRHPIYAGLLLGVLGTALASGRWRGLGAVVLVALAFWRKLRMEERGMRQLFGERYVDYARRVSALIPGVL